MRPDCLVSHCESVDTAFVCERRDELVCVCVLCVRQRKRGFVCLCVYVCVCLCCRKCRLCWSSKIVCPSDKQTTFLTTEYKYLSCVSICGVFCRLCLSVLLTVFECSIDCV